MQFRLFGPFQASHGDAAVDLGDPQQRYVLVGLLMHANEPISVERLAEIVWPNPSDRKPHLVSGYIYRLNKAFRQAGAGNLITKTQTGYVLQVPRAQIDYFRFHQLREWANANLEAGSRATAKTLLHEAINLYRGEFLADLEIDRVGRGKREALAEAHLDTLGDLAELELEAGNHRWVRDHLQTVVRDHPVRQRLAGLLMRALLADGEPERAVAVYHRTREALGNERGMQTSKQLKELLWHAEYGEAKASLPPRPIAFSDRVAELDSIRTAAERAATDRRDPGVVWISGMPGVGKTALAVQAAHLVAKSFPDGQLYVDLRGFTPNVTPSEPDDALDQLLRILGVPVETIPVATERKMALYHTWLDGTRTLIVLDNAGSERLIERLQPTSPGCLAIITSRQVGGLGATTLVRLEPLSLADAVRLFCGLVGAHRVRDQWTLVENIVELCGRVPLQIRVAATQLLRHSGWPLEHLEALLREQSPWRADTDWDGPTGATACAVSYQQLTAEQQRLFRLFAASPCAELDAFGAAALIRATVPRARALLDDLHRVSLIDETSPERYEMPDLLRAYAASLTDDDEQTSLGHLLDYYLRATATATSVAFPYDQDRQPHVPATDVTCPRFAGFKDAIGWLSAEHANLVATIRWAARRGRRDHTWRLAVLLWRYFYTTSHLQDWIATLTLALEATTREPANLSGTAHVLLRLSGASWCSGDLGSAMELASRALPLWIELDDVRGEADTLCALALPAKDLGRYDEAEQHLSAALARYERIGDVRGQANALDNLGDLYGRRHQPRRAKGYHRRALALLREIHHVQGQAHSLDNLASVCQQLGELSDAMAYLEEALRLARAVGDRSGEAYALNNIGNVLRLRGEPERAMPYHEQALTVADAVGDPMLNMELHNTSGEARRARGDHQAAMEHHRAALELARRTGTVRQRARADHGIARALHTAGRHDEAAGHWRAAVTGYQELNRPEAHDVAAELAALVCACATDPVAT